MAFDTAPIAGKQVTNATMQLQLREDVFNCSEFQGIAAQRITESWVADDTYWGNQPTSTEEGRASIDPCVLPGTSGAIWSWNLTTMTRLWATGTPNHGLLLKLTQESSTPLNYGEDFLFWPQLFNQGVLPKLSVDWVLPPAIPTVTAESIDSMDGNDAIARSTNVKVTYKSSVPEATPLNYTVTVNDSTMAPPAAELPGGEAAYWKLDETSGTAVTDSSGNNRNATLTGAHTRTPGQLGQAVNFTGGHAATSGPVINTNQSFTASAWVRLDNSTQEQTVLSQMGTNLPGFALSYQTSTAPEYDQRWTLSMINQDIPDSIHETVIQSEHLAKIGEWTHVAAQYDKDAGKICLYVDGVLAGERDHTVSWNARGAFEIGRARVLGGSLKGSVDDIHVYQRALSANELRALVGVPGTTSHNNIPSGQVLDKVFTLDNPASFKFVVKACRAGVTPPSCNESPAYRITSDAPVLPSDTDTGMADPTQPILSGMVNRPSGGPVTAKYYLYDNTGAPVGSAPLGSRTVNGGERASFQVPANTVQPGSTYKWQMTACVTAPQGEDPGTDPDPDPDPTPTPTPDPDPDPTPTPTPTPSGLVAAYGMNEGSGTTVNDATGTNDGIAIDTSWVNGKYGKALSFDGIFSLVTVEDSPSLRLDTGLTLSAWVKPSSVDNWYTVMGKDLATFDDLSYALYASSGFTPTGWLTTENEPVRVDGTDSLPVNTWRHLAVTYDGSKARLYLNGAQVGEESASGALRDDGGDFHIGGNTIYGELFDGVIDEVRVYNRAQTAAEITADMSTPLGGTSTVAAAVMKRTAATTAGDGGEVCTPKTAPLNFTTPGTPPTDPEEDVRQLTLGKDSFVIKTVKTDPTACNGDSCTVTDSTVMQMGGTAADKTATALGFKLDELPDGATVSDAILKLGTPVCPAGTCSSDASIMVTPLKSPVTGETQGPDLATDIDDSVTPYSLPLSDPQADIAGSEYQWLMLTSDSDMVVLFGDLAAGEQPSVELTYLMAGPPSEVLNLSISPGDGSAVVSWGLPESNGSFAMLDGYDLEIVDSAGVATKTMEVKEAFAAVGGLVNGETYTIRVRSKTVYGTSDWEAATVTPQPVPPLRRIRLHRAFWNSVPVPQPLITRLGRCQDRVPRYTSTE
ncbi:LamG-like jellyroll fold domain-containing protein [Nonomuraea sp. NPDC048826]|uniref:LamG-like jellyroll fold domain-containing protein n=1 Tax=Nonomuraea sp. NPDC048826 TaxID=3364347 RepID=UPI0037190422